MMIFRKHTLWLFIALCFTSCGENGQSIETEPTRLLLAYIGVDNNLNTLEIEKLNALRNGWTGKPTDHILAYVDRAGGGASLYNGSEPLHLESYGKENSANAATLSRVINDVLNTYKADHYGLLVFSHASGWLPEGTLYQPNPQETSQRHVAAVAAVAARSIMIDGKSEMELKDFAAAIPDGVFDYIVFECCFMAGIEVAYELRHKANHILASSAEIVHPGFAPVYADATNKLLEGNLSGFGQHVFNHTLTYADNSINRSATYSLINTQALEPLAAFIRNNCDFSQTVALSDIQHFDRLDGYRLFFDFEDYYSRLLDSDTQSQELSQLIENVISWKAFTPEFMTQQSGYNGFTITKHSGLTTYILQPRFGYLNDKYKTLEWADHMHLCGR